MGKYTWIGNTKKGQEILSILGANIRGLGIPRRGILQEEQLRATQIREDITGKSSLVTLSHNCNAMKPLKKDATL